MAGKHRGPNLKTPVDRSLARVTLDSKIASYVRTAAANEQRSYGNMLSVLVTEAVVRRIKR